jgi:hypothetical protein
VANFLGRPAVGLGVTGDTGRPLSDRTALSAELLGALGLIGFRAGDKYRGPDDAPPLAGVVEGASFGAVSDESHGCLLRTDEPGPGLFEVSTFSMDGQTVTVNVAGRIYGDDGPQLAARNEAGWVEWLKVHFPGVDPVTLPH